MRRITVYDPTTLSLAKAKREELSAHVQAGHPVWFDIVDPTPSDLDFIAGTFKVRPLTIDEYKSERLPAKLLSDTTTSLITWQCLKAGQTGQQVRFGCLFGRDLLITLRGADATVIDNVWDAVQTEPEKLSKGPGAILYDILDATVDDYFLAVDGISDRVDEIEDIMFGTPRPADVKQLFDMKKGMLRLRRAAAPEREVINSLLRRYPEYLDDGVRPYFEDLYDHLVRIIDLVDTLRDVTSGAMQIYQATISNNLNAIMKQLTIIATIMMPLTLVSGIFGMNLHFPGFDSVIGFYIVTTAMVVIGVGMLFWIWRRHWI